MPSGVPPLIDASELARLLEEPRLRLLDCRFDLADPAAGHAAWQQEHLPGALHADLDRHLSGPIGPATGRHPLPDSGAFERVMRGFGVDPESRVVAYDERGGMFAARLWWLLRWAGHDEVRVLDGGLARWRELGLPLESQAPAQAQAQVHTPASTSTRGRFVARPRHAWLADTDEVALRAGAPGWRVLDVRAPERFRGEVEPIDTVAGHVPGAVNLPISSCLAPDGRLLDPATLQARCDAALDGCTPAQVIAMCGSGVAACQALLALEHAGLPGARLYAGSWSEWIRDPARPVARGPQP